MHFRVWRLASVIAFAVLMSMQLGCAGTSSSSLGPSIAGSLQVPMGSLPAGQSDSPYRVSLSAQGGNPPYRWDLMSGQLPDGLQLDPMEGTISGSATLAGHYPFKLQVRDSASQPDSAQADLAIDIKQGGAQPPVCGGFGCYGPGHWRQRLGQYHNRAVW
jgi:hypothetical protein